MKLFYIGIHRTPVPGSSNSKSLELASVKDVSKFSFFERASVEQFMSFFADTVATRTEPGQRQSVEEGERMYYFTFYFFIYSFLKINQMKNLKRNLNNQLDFYGIYFFDSKIYIYIHKIGNIKLDDC